jgi:hypothetical protein
VVEPRITAAALDHLLLCSRELLLNLLIDTARRPLSILAATDLAGLALVSLSVAFLF